jgi:hypothetical protein
MALKWLERTLRSCHLLHTWSEYELTHQPTPATGDSDGPLECRVEVRRECVRCGRDEMVRIRHERGRHPAEA